MSLYSVLVVVIVGISFQYVSSGTLSSPPKNRTPSKLKDVLPVSIQLLSKPGSTLTQTHIKHHPKVQIGHTSKLVKPVKVNKKKGLIYKKKRKPKNPGKQLKGRNLVTKIKRALKPNQKRKIVKIKGKSNRRQKLRKQLRNLKIRPRKQNKSNRIKVSQKKRNWRKGRKFPKLRINIYRKKKGKGNKKKVSRKRPRNLKLKGLKDRSRLLAAIRTALGKMQRNTKAKKKSEMPTGYIRRLVGIPSKRFRGHIDLKKLNLKDVLKKAGIDLPKNKRGKKKTKTTKKVKHNKDKKNRKVKKALKRVNRKIKKVAGQLLKDRKSNVKKAVHHSNVS